MLKKLISIALGGIVFFSTSSAPLFSEAAVSLPDFYELSEGGFYRAEKLPDVNKLPVNDCIKDLDPSVIKIMIDPGHFSYYNQSPVYSPYWESVMTWKLSNYLQKELQALGVHADLTKSSLNEDPGLTDRGYMSKGYDFFISVHSNASSYTSADGPMAFTYQDLPWTDIDDTSREVGKLMADTCAKVMNTNQKGTLQKKKGTYDCDGNGVMDDEWYSVLVGSRYVGTPGILMEHSFHTNYRAAVWLYSEDNLKKLAKAEAAVFYNYFSEKKAEELAKTTTTTTTTITTTTTTAETTTTAVTTQPLVKPCLGNVNDDYTISPLDASLVLQEYAILSTENTGTFTEEQFKAADVNSDGIIDTSDASTILSYYAYLSTNIQTVAMEEWILTFEYVGETN